MFGFLKKFFGSAEEINDSYLDSVVQEVEDDEDAIMKNAMLALKTGKIVFGNVEDGVLTSRISQDED